MHYGCVIQAGLGQNPARQAAIHAGIPPQASALTVNQVCGSGLRAVALAAQAIQTGDAAIVVAGGMESMTNAPYLLPQARAGYRMGNGSLVDAMINDGLWEAYRGFHMGVGAEMIAANTGLPAKSRMPSRPSRIAAPLWRRHKVISGRDSPVEIPPARKGGPTRLFSADESVRPETQRKPSQASSQPFRILAQLPQATRLVSATARPRWSS